MGRWQFPKGKHRRSLGEMRVNCAPLAELLSRNEVGEFAQIALTFEPERARGIALSEAESKKRFSHNEQQRIANAVRWLARICTDYGKKELWKIVSALQQDANQKPPMAKSCGQTGENEMKKNLVACLFVFGSAFFVSACGDDESANDGGVEAVEAECQSDNDCALGSYCKLGQCVAGCLNDNDCNSGCECLGGECREESDKTLKCGETTKTTDDNNNGENSKGCMSRIETCDGVDNNCNDVIDEGCNPDSQPEEGQEGAEGDEEGSEGSENVSDCPMALIEIYLDFDGDGFGSNADVAIQEHCPTKKLPSNFVANNQDCDDHKIAVNPDGIEICDDADNDCDGETDEGVRNRCGDCGELPQEICDGVDNDCDAYETSEGWLNIDEGCSCITGETQVCGTNVGQCVSGTRECENTQWGECNHTYVAATPERCDGEDNDCDGDTDEGFAELGDVCYADAKGACRAVGVYVCTTNGLGVVCNAKAGTPTTEVCGNNVDEDCDGQVNDNDVCVVNATCVNPTIEICDGKDNDCDGVNDDGLGVLSCGIGACQRIVNVCVNGSLAQCVEGTPTVEVCGNTTDEDCDGTVDNGCVCVPNSVKDCNTNELGECKAGSQTCNANQQWGACIRKVNPTLEVCGNGLDEDCDGVVNDADICSQNPPCTPTNEVCDGKDNDCDNQIDEGLTGCNVVPPTCTSSAEICDGKDNDCDNQIDDGLVGCNVPPTVCVSATEVCNNVDDDCDGQVDEGLPTCNQEICGDTIDNDGDGQINEGCVEICGNSKDDDGDSAVDEGCVTPVQTEVQNGFDDDGDGLVDEGFGSCQTSIYQGKTCWVGKGECKSAEGTLTCNSDLTALICVDGKGVTLVKGDPKAEICGNGKDEDCNGIVDNVNTNIDANNCGGCGIVCPADRSSCVKGHCQVPLEKWQCSNALQDGGFETGSMVDTISGFGYWHIEKNLSGGRQVERSFETKGAPEGQMYLKISNTLKGPDWHVQLQQLDDVPTRALTVGETYSGSFKFWASQACTISLQVMDHVDFARPPDMKQTFVAGPSWNTNIISEFQVNPLVEGHTYRFAVMTGDCVGDVKIDNLVILRKTSCP